MLDFLGVPISLPSLGGWGLFVIQSLVIIRTLVKGELVPRSVLEDVRADRDARLKEAGAWKQAFDERGKAIDTLMEQNIKLTTLSEVSSHVLNSLPHPKEGAKSEQAPS